MNSLLEKKVRSRTSLFRTSVSQVLLSSVVSTRIRKGEEVFLFVRRKGERPEGVQAKGQLALLRFKSRRGMLSQASG